MSPVRRGFMLLEAAVALLVIGLTAGAALQLYGAQLRVIRREPGVLTAMALAQDRLAAVRLLDPERLVRLPDSLAGGRFTAPFAEFRWSAMATRSTLDDLYDVRVEVTWLDGHIALSTRLYSPTSGASR